VFAILKKNFHLACTAKCLCQNALQQVNEFARTKHIRTKQLSMATTAIEWKGRGVGGVKFEIISTSVNFN